MSDIRRPIRFVGFLLLAVELQTAVSAAATLQTYKYCWDDETITTSYVVGGRKAFFDDAPFMASVWRPEHYDSKHRSFGCGASVVQRGVLLTAAHCLIEKHTHLGKRLMNPLKLRVKLASVNKNDGVSYGVRRQVVHPDFDVDKPNDNDLALLFLDVAGGPKWPDAVKAACLGDESTLDRRSISCKVFGWGEGLFGVDTDELQTTRVPFVPAANCSAAWGAKLKPDIHLCAGVTKRRRRPIGTCHGDSGGPVICNSDSNVINTIVGITSWGDKFCMKNPAVFTKIPHFLPWINQIMSKSGHKWPLQPAPPTVYVPEKSTPPITDTTVCKSPELFDGSTRDAKRLKDGFKAYRGYVIVESQHLNGCAPFESDLITCVAACDRDAQCRGVYTKLDVVLVLQSRETRTCALVAVAACDLVGNRGAYKKTRKPTDWFISKRGSCASDDDDDDE